MVSMDDVWPSYDWRWQNLVYLPLQSSSDNTYIFGVSVIRHRTKSFQISVMRSSKHKMKVCCDPVASISTWYIWKQIIYQRRHDDVANISARVRHMYVTRIVTIDNDDNRTANTAFGCRQNGKSLFFIYDMIRK